jgi:outer membrane receptor protein involved in Fe transport
LWAAIWLALAGVAGPSSDARLGVSTSTSAEASAASRATEAHGPVDRVVVEARRDDAPTLDARYPVTSLDLSSLRLRALDTADVIERARGVNVRQQGGIGARQQLSLDGLSGRRVRVFIDDVPAEVSGFGYSAAIIPVSLLDRVDIYRGVVPVALGADALGGAVNYVTVDEPPEAHAAASYRVGSFQSHQAVANAGARIGETGLSIAADGWIEGSANSYDITVRAGDAQGTERDFVVPQFNDGFFGYRVGATLSYRPDEDSLVSARGFATGFVDDLQHGVILAVPLAGEATSGEDTAGGLVRAELPALTPWLGFDAWAAMSRRDVRIRDVSTNVYNVFGEITSRDSSPGELTDGIDSQIRDVELVGRANLEARMSDDHSLLLGLTPSHVRRTGQIATTSDDVAELSELVAGLEWTGQWWDDRVETSLFSKLYFQAASTPSALAGVERQRVSRSGLDPGVGAVIDLALGRSASVNLSYEWATRLPDADEIFGDGILVQSNPELRPERSHNANLLFGLDELSLGGVRIDGELGGFVRDAEDLIFTQVGEPFAVNRNIGGALFYGLSSSIDASLFASHLDVFTSLTWERGLNTAEGDDFERRRGDQIPNRPTLYGTFVVTGRLFDVLMRQAVLEAYWSARWVDEFFLFWESDGRPESKTVIPAQFIQDIGLTYDLESLAGSSTRLALNAEVRNLTDEDAFDYFRVPRPGRAFFLKVSAIY